jgi:uncharacterized protein DUF4404
MTDAKRLEASLRDLRSEIAALHVGDDEARRRLHALIQDLEQALGDPGGSGAEKKSLGEQLKIAVLRLEASHPRVAGVVNEVIESLGAMGI